jgi:hypothetical protein
MNDEFRTAGSEPHSRAPGCFIDSRRGKRFAHLGDFGALFDTGGAAKARD